MSASDIKPGYAKFLLSVKRNFKTIVTKNVGLEIDDGWFKMTHDMLTEISALPHYELKDMGKIDLIKSKYATMCVYVSGYSEAADAIIKSYETKSKSVCEVCGEPGTPSKIGHWFTVMCPVCYVTIAV